MPPCPFAGVPVANMVSSRQVMNTSFDRLNLVNTYGAFGSVGKVRAAPSSEIRAVPGVGAALSETIAAALRRKE